MKRILAILATSVVVMLSVVGCASDAKTVGESDQEEKVIWDYLDDVGDPEVLNADGSLTFNEIKINGMDCIIIEQSTDSGAGYNNVEIDCDWDSKEES